MAARWLPYFSKAFRVLVLCLPIVAAIIAVVLPIAEGLAWYHEMPIFAGENLLPALICGLIAGLFVVVFHVNKETTVVPFKNRQDFMAACRVILGDLGYEMSEKLDGCLVSRPTFRGLLLGGHIHIQPRALEGRITGPKVFVEILRARLRLHSHITGVEQTLRDSRVRLDRLYQRVEMSLRLTPEQWTAAGDQVVKKLVAAGAEVVCEVHLLAHSQEGIRGSVLEGVKDWLQKEHIQVEVHKDRSSWDEQGPPQNLEDTVLLDEANCAQA